MQNLTVDPAALKAASDKLQTAADNYQRAYAALYAEIETLRSGWSGRDNLSFTNKIKGYESNLAKMKSLIVEYSNFMTKASANYTSAQDNVVNNASRLPG